MKQNKQFIHPIALPLRQCVCWGYLLLFLLPTCTAVEEGTGNDPSGSSEQPVLLQPSFHTGEPSTRSIVNGLEPSDATTTIDKISSVMLYVTEENGYPFYPGVENGTNKLANGLSLFTAKGSSGNLTWEGNPAVNLFNATARVFAYSPSGADFTASTTDDKHTIKVKVPADMTFNGANTWECNTVDYLYGSGSSTVGSSVSITGSNKASFKPNIYLQHALAQVVFKMQTAADREVDATYDYVKKITLHSASSVFLATTGSATTTMQIKDGTLGISAGVADLNFVADPLANAVKCGANKSPVVVAYGLVAPMTKTPTDISMTVVLGKTTDATNERQLTVKVDDFQQIKWEKGKRYTYNLILSDRNISVAKATIENWNYNEQDGTLRPDGF